MRGSDAGIAQLVEHDLAKVGVASSSLVSRSKVSLRSPGPAGASSFQGGRPLRLSASGDGTPSRGAARSSHSHFFCYSFQLRRGNSSVGRARPCQGRGREFESRFPLQFLQNLGSPGFCFLGGSQSFGRAIRAQWPGGRVVMQRPAKPCTPVRFRPWPPLRRSACRPTARSPHRAGFFVPAVHGGHLSGCRRATLFVAGAGAASSWCRSGQRKSVQINGCRPYFPKLPPDVPLTSRS